MGNRNTIPGRFFTHNEALDFAVAAASYKSNRLHELFTILLRKEVEASRRLKEIAFGEASVHVFRNEVVAHSGGVKVV